MLYQELRRGVVDDEKAYCIQPKHHIMIHLAEHSSNNPIAEWCYGDESQIGKACKVVEHMSRPQIVAKLVPRYITTRTWMS